MPNNIIYELDLFMNKQHQFFATYEKTAHPFRSTGFGLK